MSFADYARHGWRLCAIRKGSKAPDYAQWNERPIAADACDGLDGAGLLHALSGTCAIDIDDMGKARIWLAERNVDIDALLVAPEAVRIESGRPNRAKLLYRLKKPLRTVKPEYSGLELRCATAEGKSVQDVLPPSTHPDTKKPYQWAYGEPLIGDWRTLPPIPAALFAAWRALVTEPTAPIMPAQPSASVAKLRELVKGKSPDAPYDDWIKVGMVLHHETRGAQEGLDLWDEWSAKSVKYRGISDLLTHWHSFTSAPGKRVATAASLNTAASRDEFEDVKPGENSEEATKLAQETENVAREASRKERRNEAISKLEARLVYVVSAEKYFDLERHRLIGSDNALEHQFTGIMPSYKGVRGSPVKWLKQSTTKKFIDAMGFHPGEGVLFESGGRQFANSYRNTLPEPVEPTALEREKIDWLFGRIDDDVFRKWLLQFFGHIVQKPGTKIMSAPLIWSEIQGNGKTTLLRAIPSRLVGQQYSREVTAALLQSDFNDYVLDAWHLNLTEFRAGTRGERTAISSKLKAWIADDEIAVHPKGSMAYTMPNHFFVTATSNEDDAASLDNQDRRWAVHEMHAPQFTPAEQVWIYNEFLNTPRAAAVLRHYFLNVDLTGFTPSAKAPATEAHRAMAEASVPLDRELLVSAFEQRIGPFERDVLLMSDLVQYVHKHSPAKPSANRLGRVIAGQPFNGKSKIFRLGERVFRAVILRNADLWRNATGQKLFAHINGEDIDLLD